MRDIVPCERQPVTLPVEAAEPLFPPAALPLRRRALQLLHGALYWSGLSHAWVQASRPAGAVVLNYHSVAAPERALWIDPSNHTAPESFAQQMEFLAAHRSVISMDRLLEALAGGDPLPAASVVLTFDDGYRDNLELAAPVLERHGLPAMLYLPTGLVGLGTPQWADVLYSAFRTRRRQRLRVPGTDTSFGLSKQAGRAAAFAVMCSRLMVAGEAEREGILGEVVAQLEPAMEAPRLMLTWEEIRTLRQKHPRFEVGLHTAGHIDLTGQREEVVRQELERCIADAGRELGERPLHFAYPYNRYDERTRRLVEGFGFRSAVCSGASRVTAASDGLALPRLPVPPSMTLLRFWTSGAYPELSRTLVGRA